MKRLPPRHPAFRRVSLFFRAEPTQYGSRQGFRAAALRRAYQLIAAINIFNFLLKVFAGYIVFKLA
jgi:hypothetical protein